MRLLLLSDHLSIHTQKWARSLAENGLEILIFSLSPGSDEHYADLANIRVISQSVDSQKLNDHNPFNKISYLLNLKRLKAEIQDFKPDILHAHYASSYGLLGALSNFHPFIISVWGWDIYHFPSNFITRGVLKHNLKKADAILSTSHVMAEETKKYTNKNIEVTPFGIDVEKFKPFEVKSLFPEDAFVIGTIKTLEKKYGIDLLIRAFAKLRENIEDKNLKLLIVGSGSEEENLKVLCKELNIWEDTIFTGKIEHKEVPLYINMLDIYVALSTLESESFGVAIVEASACAKPVVVSRVGGLPEVVDEGKTGLIVNPKDHISACKALKELVTDIEKCKQYGNAGRERVLEKYNWTDSVKQMLSIYDKLI